MRSTWLLPLMLAAGCNGQHLQVGGGLDGGGGSDGDVSSSSHSLVFGVFGDCRPQNPNDAPNYPTAVLTNIFTMMQAKGAQLAVGTGDYMFADYAAAVDAQVSLHLQASAAFKGPIYRTLGNHECTGATRSNCPNGDETDNMKAFMTRLLPQGLTTTPYYRVDVDTAHGKAKFLFIAGNAWSQAQSDWLKRQLADPTAYTFAIRHVPPSTSAPGVAESEALLRAAPFTVELLGHFHEYRRLDSQHVISGNGGAPHRSGEIAGYGFLLVEQLSDGNLAATEYDETTGNAVDTWKISPAGANVN